jgi:hypothetical protein
LISTIWRPRNHTGSTAMKVVKHKLLALYG